MSQGFPVICYRKPDRKGQFCWDTGPGVPGTPGQPGGFQKFYVIFSYVPFLLPNDTKLLLTIKYCEVNLKSTNFTRNFAKKSFFRGDFDSEGAKCPKTYEAYFSANDFMSEGTDRQS